MDDIDTDTSLALLSSLLEPASFPLDELLDALTSCHGDVARAAEQLLLPRVKSAGKRKAGTSLESWLGRKKGRATEPETPRTPPLPRRDPSSSGPSSSTKPVNLLSVLQQAESTKPKNPPRPPVLLSTQATIDKHRLPLTILDSPLSPAFASALYLTMMEESEKWAKHKWYLAGKLVEAPHSATGYKRKGGGFGDDKGESRYFYSGIELPIPNDYPRLLDQASSMVEDVVNEALSKRKRSPLEFAGPWRANVCGVNRYDGSASNVGWHADQMTYLGPHCTIASMSLGTPRNFRLRQTETVDPSHSTGQPIRTYEIQLGHNTLVLMNAGCQERFKHTVPPQKALDLFRPAFDIDQRPIPLHAQSTFTSRINITFRFYREDFHPLPVPGPGARAGTPICKCGIPTLLRADQKGKARTKLPPSPAKAAADSKDGVLTDDMVWFWQCQSPGQTGDMRGCGFFKILDMKGEGRGPCVGEV